MHFHPRFGTVKKQKAFVNVKKAQRSLTLTTQRAENKTCEQPIFQHTKTNYVRENDYILYVRENDKTIFN